MILFDLKGVIRKQPIEILPRWIAYLCKRIYNWYLQQVLSFKLNLQELFIEQSNYVNQNVLISRYTSSADMLLSSSRSGIELFILYFYLGSTLFRTTL